MIDMKRGSPKNHLFLDEPPLVFLPSLAKAIGVDKAIIVQQVHYWVEKKRDVKKLNWIYNSYADWQKQFPFWSISHIRRMIRELEETGILVSGNFNRVKADRTKWYTIDYDRIGELFISSSSGVDEPDTDIHLETGDSIPDSMVPGTAAGEKFPDACDPNEQMMGEEFPDACVPDERSICPDRAVQVSRMNSPCAPDEQSICPDRAVQVPQLNKPIPETTTEITSETTTEITAESTLERNPCAYAPGRDIPHACDTQNTTRPADEDPHPSSSQILSPTAVDEAPQTSANPRTLFDTEAKDSIQPTPQIREKTPIPSTPPSGTPPSSRAKSKGSQSAGSADPAIPRVIDAFHVAVIDTYGFKPGLQAGRDAKAIKQILPYADEDTLSTYVADFVTSGQWKTEGSPYLFEFVTAKRINAYQIRLSEQRRTQPVGAGSIPYQEIIEHLNDRTGSTFKASDPSTVRLIGDRWKEGYRLEDFLKVIDNMAGKWGRDVKMMEFLRPATLFGEKFGNYLGVKVTPVDRGLVSNSGYRAYQAGQEWIRQEEERDSQEEKREPGSDNRDDPCDFGGGMNMASDSRTDISHARIRL